MDDLVLFNEWQLAFEEFHQAKSVLTQLSLTAPVSAVTEQQLELAATILQKAFKKLNALDTKIMYRNAERWASYYGV